MIKPYNLLWLVLLSYYSFSQNTIIFKSDATCGKDAIMTNSSTWSNGTVPITIPNANSFWLRVEAWTAFAHGAPEHDWRSLIEFEALKNIQSAELNSATLTLWRSHLPQCFYARWGCQ